MEVRTLPVDTVVELVNGWGSVPRERAANRPFPPAAPAGGCATNRSSQERFVAHPPSHGALVAVADRLYPVFAAATAAERARLLTAVMAECDVRPALTVDRDDHIRPAWTVPRKRDALLAAAAVTLHAQLAEHEHERLGVCASTSCGDVYVDVSPRAHRRYCSVTCSNRERVAAFRRRAAESS